MRSLLIILGSAALVLVAAVIIVPSLVPASAVKDQLSAYVKQSTGRELVIAGDGQFQLFPSTGVTFEQVQLSGPDADPQRPFLRAQAVTAELSLLSLLSGGATFDALTLEGAIIDLRAEADGTVNWEFSEDAGTRQPAMAQPIHYAGTAAAAPMRVGIRQVSLRNSTIRYHAPGGSDPLEITDANLVLLMPAPDSTATVSGAFALRGRQIDVDASLETLALLNAGERAKLAAEMSGAFGALNFNGHLTPENVLTGALSANADDPAEVFALTGANAAPAISSASLKANLDAREDALHLTDLRAVLNEMTAAGELSVSMGSSRPALTGRLDFDTLDLDAFRMEPLPERDSADAGNAGLWPARAAASDDIRLNLQGLDALDADLTLTAQTLQREALTARDAAARARLQNATLSLGLTRLSLYDGSATGAFEVSAHQGVPVISATVDVREVDALPLFSDASSFDWLSGKLNGKINVASGGHTLGELRSRLQGDAGMRMHDGGLEGLDLPGMLARVQSGDLTEFGRREGDRTRFTRLEANWTIRKGVARTDDLLLEGPFVRAQGKGEVDIRRERVDLRLTPRVLSRANDAQPGMGIELPIRMEGDWGNPNIYPDVEEVLKDPEKSLGAAKNFGKAVEELTGGEVSEDDFKNAIEGLFGGKKE